MQRFEVDNELALLARKNLAISGMFVFLTDEQLSSLVKMANEVLVFDSGETVIASEGTPDFFLVIIRGEISVSLGEQKNFIEIARLGPGRLVGEMAMIANETHSYSYCARGKLAALCFDSVSFYDMILTIPGVNIPLSGPCSEKMKQAATYATFIENRKTLPSLDSVLLKLLPADFVQRYRLIPLRQRDDLLLIGHTGAIDREHLDSIARALPAFDIRPVCFDNEYFNRLFQTACGANPLISVSGKKIRHIDELLIRLVEEGGSDLYISAGQIPRWRIDGEILEVSETSITSSSEVLELLKPIARAEILASFSDSNDEDFAYSMGDSCRFRVNLLRDHHGVGAVFRYIPKEILSLEELGLPDILKEFCIQSKGLVLITGPTGCGKTTTLSAMIEWINQRRKCHILTIEDPIEFIHNSRQALINQREVGIHTRSFAKALRAGLRENPDVVMVGEIRDNETMAMALETANTGHLVFATLHTSTASSTIDRVIDNFPPDGQNQIRMFLAENLIGVVCQTLCRRIGGGSIAAFEILVMDPAMANLVRSSKTFMLPNAMITAHAKGNRLLNEDLILMVKNNLISLEEAMMRTRDKAELERKLAEAG